VGQLSLQSTPYKTGDCSQRPWGSWVIIACGTSYVVKEIVIIPGARISLQRHRYRQETWVIIQGTAEVTLGDSNFIKPVGSAITVPTGMPHRVANVGSTPLIIVEVQQGPQLIEDDIERLDDDYGRA